MKTSKVFTYTFISMVILSLATTGIMMILQGFWPGAIIMGGAITAIVGILNVTHKK